MNGTVLLKNAPTAGTATAASPQKSCGRCVAKAGFAGSVMDVFRSDPFNVRPGNADVGQFAVAQMCKLVHGDAISLPGVEETAD